MHLCKAQLLAEVNYLLGDPPAWNGVPWPVSGWAVLLCGTQGHCRESSGGDPGSVACLWIWGSPVHCLLPREEIAAGTSVCFPVACLASKERGKKKKGKKKLPTHPNTKTCSSVFALAGHSKGFLIFTGPCSEYFPHVLSAEPSETWLSSVCMQWVSPRILYGSPPLLPVLLFWWNQFAHWSLCWDPWWGKVPRKGRIANNIFVFSLIWDASLF